jgi:hypothetical protein
MDTFYFALIMLGFVAAIVFYERSTHDAAEWHVVTRYRRVTLVNGIKSTGTKLWGRKINGVWSYREMSADEYNIHLGDVSL